MLSGGARRLISMYALQPGTRAVVATVDDRGLHAALALIDAGVELACVADLRENGSAGPKGALKRLGVEVLNGATVLEATGRGHVSSVVVGPPGSNASERSFGVDLLVVSGGSAPATSLAAQAGAKTAYDEERGYFTLAHVPEDVHVAGQLSGHGELEAAELSGSVAGAEAAHALGLGSEDSRARATQERERIDRPEAWPAQVAVPPPGDERAQRQVLRLPLRGRDREGHPPVRGGGLRLDRALQALHHHHDGPVPGPHVPAARRAADGEGDRHKHGRRGHHDPAPALARRADGRPGRTALRAREALLDPRAPPRARGQRDVGGRLAPRLRLRRPEGRGDGGAQGRRADRRVHARQADRARPGRRRVPRPPLPEPLLEPEARPHPLRRDRERQRPHHGRRHHLPARRRQLLRDHHLERRRRDLRLVHLVARRLAASTCTSPTSRRGSPP